MSVSTRAIAAKITRRDGQVWGVTDAPVPFTFAGVEYSPFNGADVSNLSMNAGTSPDNLEVRTIQSAILAQITPIDLLAKRYEQARMWIYEVDYTNPNTNWRVVQQFYLRKARLADTEMVLGFEEILGLLKNATGLSLQSSCQWAKFGNCGCDPGLLAGLRANGSHNLTVTAVIDNLNLQLGTDSTAPGYYDAGELIPLTGANGAAAGADINTHTVIGGGVIQIGYFPPLEAPVAPGDTFTLVRGCTRLRTFCQTVLNSHNPSGTNIENFNGFNMPTPDGIHTAGRP